MDEKSGELPRAVVAAVLAAYETKGVEAFSLDWKFLRTMQTTVGGKTYHNLVDGEWETIIPLVETEGMNVTAEDLKRFGYVEWQEMIAAETGLQPITIIDPIRKTRFGKRVARFGIKIDAKTPDEKLVRAKDKIHDAIQKIINNLEQGVPSAEFLSSPVSPDPGGIDFNPNNVNFSEEGGQLKIEFTSIGLEALNPETISGIVPVIINISPLPSILPLLGLAPQREEEEEFELSKK